MQSDSIMSSTTTIFFAETVSTLLTIYEVNLGYVSKVGGHNSPSFDLCFNMVRCPGLPLLYCLLSSASYTKSHKGLIVSRVVLKVQHQKQSCG